MRPLESKLFLFTISGMMGDANDDNSDELEKSISQIGDFSKNVSETLENLGKKLKTEKLANKNLSALFAESEKEIEFLKLELREVRKGKENLQKNYEDVQKECDYKDTKIESLNLEVTELKKIIESAFLSAKNTLKSMSNVVKTSAMPEIVPPQSVTQSSPKNTCNEGGEPSATTEIVPEQIEKVQRAQISHSNDGEDQISDHLPDHQADQTPDDQMQIIPQPEEQGQQQQPTEVTQLENTISMETLPSQVPSQFLQSSPQNTSCEGSLLADLDTSGTSGLQSCLAKNNSELTYLQAVQTPDDQFQIIPQSEEQQQQQAEVTQLENTISMEILPSQVPSQFLQSPQNTSCKAPGTSGTSGLQSSLAENDSELAVMGYVYQTPITLSNIAETTRDDQGEEIKTEIEFELTKLENTIPPPIATSSNQVLPQSVTRSSPENISNEGGESSAMPEIVPKQCEKVQKAQISYSNDGEEQITDLMATSSTQITPQFVMQSGPKNTSNKGSPLAILATPGTSRVKSSLTTPDKVIERIDDESDQTYDDHLVGKIIRGNYRSSGWHNGKIEYFNTNLKEYLVLFDDGSSDYIKEDDIDGKDVILLDDALATKRKSGGKVRHKFSSKGRTIKSTLKQTAPKILKQKNKKCRKPKVKGKVSKDKYPAIMKVVKKRGRKKTALKGQGSNQKELVEGTFKSISEVIGLVWLFNKRRSMPSDARTLGLLACSHRFDIPRPNDDMFEEIVDVSADLSDQKRLLYKKEARKPQCLDLLLDRRLQLKSEEEKRIEKYWTTPPVYSKTDTSGKILLKSTETMANGKVIKAKNDSKKLARRPCKNNPEGLIKVHIF